MTSKNLYKNLLAIGLLEDGAAAPGPADLRGFVEGQ
jgi:hypothetical protein